jgi:hypothetical protein
MRIRLGATPGERREMPAGRHRGPRPLVNHHGRGADEPSRPSWPLGSGSARRRRPPKVDRPLPVFNTQPLVDAPFTQRTRLPAPDPVLEPPPKSLAAVPMRLINLVRGGERPGVRATPNLRSTGIHPRQQAPDGIGFEVEATHRFTELSLTPQPECIAGETCKYCLRPMRDSL